MSIVKLFYIFLASLMASLLIMPSLYSLSIKVGGIDLPDCDRKIHSTAIPRIGGIAIFFGFLIAVLIFYPASDFLSGLVTGSLIIFLVGFADDLFCLLPKQKLLGQITGTSIGVILSQNFIMSLGDPLSSGSVYLPAFVAIPFTIFCIVGLINAMNMIDGLDGLAGGITAIAALAIAIISYSCGVPHVLFLSIALLGAVIGFLAHNTYPARIFMGDSGSNLLGFALGMIIVKLIAEVPTISPITALFILFIPVFDTLAVMASRLLSGRPIMEADNAHIHHKLLAAGFGHKGTVITIFGWAYIMAAIAVMYNRLSDGHLEIILLTSTAILHFLLFCITKRFRNKISNFANKPLLAKSWQPCLEKASNKLIIVARYLVVIILSLPFTINLAPVPWQTALSAALLCSMLLSLIGSYPWLNRLLIIVLHITAAYFLFMTENYGGDSVFGSNVTLILSAILLSLLSIILGIKLLVTRHFNFTLHSAVEFPVFLSVVFMPLLPDSITAPYHLLTVAGKIIILFSAFKFVLNSEQPKQNRTVVLASVLALVYTLVK